MSIEAVLGKLTEALERNNELLEKVLSGRSEIQDKKTKSEKETKTEKPAKAESKAKTEKPAKATKSSALTLKDVTKVLASYMDTEDDDEYEARALKVKKKLKEFGAASAKELDEEDFAEVIEWAEEQIAALDDEDEDEAPPAKRGKASSAKSTKKKPVEDDDEDEEDDEEEDDED